MQSSQLFDGGRRRTAINLGGANRAELTQADLIQRAKREREGREEARRREKAAAKIQAFCRGRFAASQTRSLFRARFDSLLASSPADPSSVLTATKLLALLFVDGNSGDLKRLAAWCRAVLASDKGATDKTPLLLSLYSHNGESWSVLIRQTIAILFIQATAHPAAPQAALFLEITKILCDPTSYTKWKVIKRQGIMPLEYLLARNFYTQLRALVLAIPPETRSHPTLPAAIALALLPFKAFPAPAPTPAAKSNSTLALSPQRTAALTSFTLSILSIPLLPHRIPLSSLTALAGMPLEAILVHAASPPLETELQTLEPEKAAHLLANVLAFSSKRIAGFSSSKVLNGYLRVLQLLLNRLPSSLFIEKRTEVAEDVKGKGKTTEVMVIEDSDDEDEDDARVIQRAREKVGTTRTAKDADGDITMAPMATVPNPPPSNPRTTFTLDPRTFTFLSSLASREHLTAVLTLSTRYSSTSRPYLASFLVSLLTTWPAKRDEIINTIVYGPSSGSGAGERGGGLLRELFRGYVRAGALGRLLGRAGKDQGGAIMQAVSDPTLGMDWTTLILLSQLYARCLLTLGDDEFYSTRNPLTLDEVVGLSGLLRNLAFSLYWQEGNFGAGESELVVVGTRMGIEALRSLATTLLQQIHARDSRRSFTPQGHWLMTSQFDLASFIQTVVIEDQKLDADEEPPVGRGSAWDDGEEEEPARRPLSHAKATLSKRQMSFISPRLGVLNNIPFVIPFETRVAIFRQFVDNDRQRLGIDRHAYDRSKRHRAVIRRDHLSEDAYAHLSGLGPALKSTIQIIFVDEHGMEERGIDGGGLFKELLTSLSKEAFDTDRGLWLATKQQELYPNPHSYARESTSLSWYSFLGRVLGKALYEGILVDVRFAAFFLSKWLGRQSYLDDLQSLDPELYNGLIFLKNHTGDVEADLSLNFTVTDDDFGMSKTIDLIPGGSEVAVTNENRIHYIYLMSNYRLNAQLEKQCAAFFAGLSEIIPERFLRMFNQAELRVLVGGVDQPIDVADLKANTVYGGWDGDEANETIRAFWRVVEGFDKDDRSKLVKFVTSCARPPLLGFKELVPRFAIRAAGADQTRLPTSSTCVNLLKLPEYTDEDNLRQKLLYAINSGAGFDLS